VLHDNQANISIIWLELLQSIAPAKSEVKVNDARVLQLHIKDTGYLEEFFTVYLSKETCADELRLAEAVDMYNIIYIPKTWFVVHLPDWDKEFIWNGKLYVANFAQYYDVHATLVVTKAEEARAKKAYKLLCNAGLSSVLDAIHLIEDGIATNLPALVAADFQRAIELFGPPVEYISGTTTKKAIMITCF